MFYRSVLILFSRQSFSGISSCVPMYTSVSVLLNLVPGVLGQVVSRVVEGISAA